MWTSDRLRLVPALLAVAVVSATVAGGTAAGIGASSGMSGTNASAARSAPLAPAWSITPSPNAIAAETPNVLNATMCVSSWDCWAVGYYLAGNTQQTLIERWAGTSWAIVPSPNNSATQDNVLNGVTCVSSSDCWAVGSSFGADGINLSDQTLIEHWDGTSWTVVASPNALLTQDNFLTGVACASASDCWAVGYSWTGSTHQTLIVRWNGVLWTIAVSPNTGSIPQPQENYLNAVTCVSTANCWAVGYDVASFVARTLIVRWDGSSWTIVASPNASATQLNILSGVTCVSASDCWAVGHYRTGSTFKTLIERWDGNSWAVVASPNAGATQQNYLSGVTCVAASDCWAVGHSVAGGTEQTLIERWDGSSWEVVSSPNTSATQHNRFFSVTCMSASDCWAAGSARTGSGSGSTYQTVIERWDGTSWAIVTSPNATVAPNNRFFDVTCVSASDCWAVGTYHTGSKYRTLVERWDGTSWAIFPSPNAGSSGSNVLTGVTCVSASNCWAVGYSGLIERTLIVRWDGSSWTILPSPNTSGFQNNLLSAVTCVSASDCWAVGYVWTGDNFQNLILKWNGTSWTLVSAPNTGATRHNHLYGVACLSASDCWAVGSYHTGSTYQTLIVQWDGTSWAIAASPNTSATQLNHLSSVACSSASDCWSVGYSHGEGDTEQTLIERWEGSSWSIVPSPNTSTTLNNSLRGVTCVSALDCWAVGYSVAGTTQQTLVERWDGTSWAIVPSPGSAVQNDRLFDVTCAAASDCQAAGHSGTEGAYRTLAMTYATGPTAVRVRSFEAALKPGTRRVTLRWRTATDSGLAGFHVFRSDNASLVRRTRTLIVSKAKLGGSTYVFRDVLPAGAKRGRYRLQAVRLDGSKAFVGTAESMSR